MSVYWKVYFKSLLAKEMIKKQACSLTFTLKLQIGMSLKCSLLNVSLMWENIGNQKGINLQWSSSTNPKENGNGRSEAQIFTQKACISKRSRALETWSPRMNRGWLCDWLYGIWFKCILVLIFTLSEESQETRVYTYKKKDLILLDYYINPWALVLPWSGFLELAGTAALLTW